MANANGDRGDEPERSPWSGSSTPPNVYGNFSRPGLADDMMESMDAERTAEDMAPPPDIRTAHVVRERMHNHLVELEESGEYDIRALAPLRHLLDQDWTDPNVRSRLKAKVEAEDAKAAQAAPGAGVAPAKEWFASFDPATAETVQVPTVTDPSTPQARAPGAVPVGQPRPPAVSQARPPAVAQAPGNQPAPRPPVPGTPAPSPNRAPQNPAAVAARPQAPPNPAAAAAKSQSPPNPAPAGAGPQSLPNPAAAKPQAAQSSAPPRPQSPTSPPQVSGNPAAFAAQDRVAAARAEVFQKPLTPPVATPIPAGAAPVEAHGLIFDDDDTAGEKKLRSKAAKLLSAPLKRDKRRLRPWLLAVGAALVVGALAVPESVFAGDPVRLAPPRFVLTSEPKAEIFRGDELLGQTPMLLEASQVGEAGLTLQAPGFEPQSFTLTEPVSEGRVDKHQVVLTVAPVPLDWTGLPSGSKLTWQGQAATVETLATALPGTYSLKVAAPDRPPVTLSVVVPAPGASGSAGPGKQLEQAFSKQPALSVSLKGKGKAPKLPLSVTVSQSDKGKSFTKTAPLDGKAASKLVLPGGGTYKVKVPASSTHLAFSKTVTLKEGGSQNLEIALTPVPPKVASAPAPSSGGGGGGGYVPEPVYYSPPPAYYGGGGGGSGGGGGGGSIAPPSF